VIPSNGRVGCLWRFLRHAFAPLSLGEEAGQPKLGPSSAVLPKRAEWSLLLMTTGPFWGTGGHKGPAPVDIRSAALTT
jgi:hypothetical protein